jgi:hypothetical protein
VGLVVFKKKKGKRKREVTMVLEERKTNFSHNPCCILYFFMRKFVGSCSDFFLNHMVK